MVAVDPCAAHQIKNVIASHTASTTSHITTAAIVGALLFGGMFLLLLSLLFYYGYVSDRPTPASGSASRSRVDLWPRGYTLGIDPTAALFPLRVRPRGVSRNPGAGGAPLVPPHTARPPAIATEPLPRYEYPPPYESPVSDDHSSPLSTGSTAAGVFETSDTATALTPP